MRRALRAGALVLSLAALPAAGAHGAEPPTTAVVGASTPGAARALADDLRDAGLTVTAIPRIGAMEVSGEGLAAVRATLSGDPRVDWVEPPRDRTLFAVALSPDAIDSQTGRTYGWSVDTVDATEALAMMAGSFPVTVAVIDSGVDVTHPDLAGRIGPGYDALTDGTGVRDMVGHGTFVAGLISAIDGNGLGSRGVAGATTVLPMRITTTGAIKSTDAAKAIVRAVEDGAGVINLSFGGATISDVEKEALEYAEEEDVLVVAAAGNSYQSGNPLQYPAAAIGGVKGGWSAGLSVAATDPLGRHARFSTANDFVSVAAPGAGSGECGDGVFSTIPGSQASLWDGSTAGACTRVVGELGNSTGRYGYGEGTSFAAPLVSGAAALARDVNPHLSAEQTADVITRSAHQTIGVGWNSQTGSGVLDVDGAVAMARAYDTVAPAPALSVVPRAGALGVSIAGVDVAGPGSTPAGIASYRLERSGDGVIYTPVGPSQATPVRVDDVVPAGERRWYRGTVCDQVRNCATTLSGAVTSSPPATPPSGIAKTIPPGIASPAVGRPRTCRACVIVSFTARGTGPLRWAATLAPGAGVRGARKTGSARANQRIVVRVPLSRLPTCRSRATVTISVFSPTASSHTSRTVAFTGRCVRRARR